MDTANALSITTRTVERDVARMRDSGVPIRVQRGPGGGYLFDVRSNIEPIALESGEAAALIVALVARGPTATDSALTSMHKLTQALLPQHLATPPTQSDEGSAIGH